jgi:hypothetical protein
MTAILVKKIQLKQGADRPYICGPRRHPRPISEVILRCGKFVIKSRLPGSSWLRAGDANSHYRNRPHHKRTPDGRVDHWHIGRRAICNRFPLDNHANINARGPPSNLACGVANLRIRQRIASRPVCRNHAHQHENHSDFRLTVRQTVSDPPRGVVAPTDERTIARGQVTI